ncbi:cytochrome B [Comamonas serinivorans]|uniref:Cytochrome B n=2 Tax=Comamonas serinivorans TaxID=1082851 RepID=A0A1Y0EJQ1_9BURK|nr:cytochrome B [Comamonas serinivorans]
MTLPLIPDGPRHYPRAARWLHWLMAIGLIWILTSASVHALLPKSGLDEFMWPTHKHVGTVLLVLVVIRLGLAVAQRAARPRSTSRLASLGHVALYALMLAIPTLGLLRQIGSGRAFSPLGLPLIPGFDGPKIDGLVNLGNDLHGELGWVLLALALGHVLMVIVHVVKGEAHIWHRMRG